MPQQSGLTRRSFARVVGLGAAACFSRQSGASPILAPDPTGFEFAFLTDLHTQPELGAGAGVAKCIGHINGLKKRPDFAITGGDLIMDALEVDQDRLSLQWKLFDQCLAPLEMPVHHTVGNHDVTGWSSKAKISKSAENYGKRIFADRYGKGRTYQSFDHKGWHFIQLDSIGQNPKTGDYLGQLDDAQIDWLKNDLASVKRGTPVIIATHIPFYSVLQQYAKGPTAASDSRSLIGNVASIRKLLDQSNVKLVLSGHGHLLERIEFAGTVYLQGGAVSGRWWKGPVYGNPEGYVVVRCLPDGSFTTRYESYGWTAQTS